MGSFSQWRGEAYQLVGQATRPLGPVDVTLANTRVEFLAKRHHLDADAAAVIRKDGAVAPAVAVYGGISLGANGAYDVTIASADTLQLTKDELLSYFVRLTEPTGTETVIDSGTLRVRYA